MDYQYYELALQLTSILEKKNPRNAKLRKLKIETLIAKENYDEAIKMLQSFIDEQPYNISAWKTMAEAHVGKGDFREALDNIEYCLAINPMYKQALLLKAHCFFHLNQLNQAHEIYQELEEKDSLNGRIYYMDAVTLANMEKFEEAKEVLEKALKYISDDDEDRIQILLHKAYIESKCHNINRALTALEDARKISSDQSDIDYNLLMGEILLENDREREAAEQFEIAYNESKNKQQTLLTMGIAYAETMHYSTALSLLESFTAEYNEKEGVVAIPYIAYCYKKLHDEENYLKFLRKAVSADREITEFLFSKDYPSIQPEEYYLYAFKNAYGRFPEEWE